MQVKYRGSDHIKIASSVTHKGLVTSIQNSFPSTRNQTPWSPSHPNLNTWTSALSPNKVMHKPVATIWKLRSMFQSIILNKEFSISSESFQLDLGHSAPRISTIINTNTYTLSSVSPESESSIFPYFSPCTMEFSISRRLKTGQGTPGHEAWRDSPPMMNVHHKCSAVSGHIFHTVVNFSCRVNFWIWGSQGEAEKVREPFNQRDWLLFGWAAGKISQISWAWITMCWIRKNRVLICTAFKVLLRFSYVAKLESCTWR